MRPLLAGPAAIFDKYVWMERSHAFARPGVNCAQSIVYEMKASDYRWGEVLVIKTHSDHWIAGQVDILAGGRRILTSFSNERLGSTMHYATDVGDNRRCLLNAASTAPPATPAASAGPPTGSRIPDLTNTPRTPATTIQLDAGLTWDARPAVETFRLDLMHGSTEQLNFDLPPIAAGTPVRIELWGVSSIDWTGVTLEISTYEVVPNNPVAFRAQLDPRLGIYHSQPDQRPHLNECRTKIGASECADVRTTLCQQDAATLLRPECADVARERETSARVIDQSTGTPPPPAPVETPPPQPSDRAVWVPGHWVVARSVWAFWSAGFWRVPDEDLSEGRTASAPSAPPARSEPPPTTPPPAPGAVWTAGSWSWQGSWTWSNGTWRMPPKPNQTWRPATWRASGQASFKLDPGGWISR